MSRLNINFSKIMVTDLVDKFTNMIPSSKNKKETQLEQYKGPVVSEKDKLSPFDSNCNQKLIADVVSLFNDIGIDQAGEQYLVEQHKVTYVDGTSKIFEVHTSSSGVTISKVKEPSLSK